MTTIQELHDRLSPCERCRRGWLLLVRTSSGLLCPTCFRNTDDLERVLMDRRDPPTPILVGEAYRLGLITDWQKTFALDTGRKAWEELSKKQRDYRRLVNWNILRGYGYDPAVVKREWPIRPRL